MEHSIIAVKTKGSYETIVCHYEQGEFLESLLLNKFANQNDALTLIAQGDIRCLNAKQYFRYNRDLGYSWNQSQPVSHSHESLLVHYCQAIGAANVYIFDNGWNHIKLNSTSDFGAIEACRSLWRESA